jgi:biopolymer transport protein ExbB/TolQ
MTIHDTSVFVTGLVIGAVLILLGCFLDHVRQRRRRHTFTREDRRKLELRKRALEALHESNERTAALLSVYDRIMEEWKRAEAKAFALTALGEEQTAAQENEWCQWTRRCMACRKLSQYLLTLIGEEMALNMKEKEYSDYVESQLG